MKIEHGFNQKTREFWVDLASKFKSKTDIARHLGVGLWSVSYWMNFHDVKTDGRQFAHNKLDIPPKEELEELYKTKSILEISKYYKNVSNVTVKKWFKHYNINLRDHKTNQKKISYPKFQQTCMDRYGTSFILPPVHSKAETEIKEWLNSLGFNFHSNRGILSGNRELDGYDPQLKAAFEYCGLWWHCEKNQQDKKYHLKKYQECSAQGIKLFTIYENEWRDRKEQIKNFLKGSLGKNSIKIYARDCKVLIVNKSEPMVMKFFDENHIQGAPKGYEFCVILSYNNIIVGAMSFGKHHRQNVEPCLVLSRLCWKHDHTVIGGSARMFSKVPKDKKIISWSDNRWSPEGGVYKRLGFTLETEYDPGYDYVNNQSKFKHKQTMMKSNIGAKQGQTEKERCEELGWYRIWDCGKKKWVITPT